MFSQDKPRSDLALFKILDGRLRELSDAFDGLRRQVHANSGEPEPRGVAAGLSGPGKTQVPERSADRVDPQARIIERIREQGSPGVAAFAAATVELTAVTTTQPSRLRVKWDRPVIRATILGTNIMGTAAPSRSDSSVVQVDLVSPPFSPTLPIRLRVVSSGDPELVSVEQIF